MTSIATRILKGETIQQGDALPNRVEEDTRKARSFILNAVKIHVQNVADYLADWQKGGFSYRDDLPNCAPPFEVMWFEYHFGSRTFGVGIQGVENGPGRTFPWTLHWSVVATSLDNQTISAVAQSSWNVTEDGHLDIDHSREIFIEPPWGELFWNDEKDENYNAAMFVTLALPALMAICFMHCRNVEMIDMNIAKIGKGSQLQRRRPLAEWKMLKIRAMTKILDGSGERGDSLATRLHICRGHFKDFTKSGLFGRHKGVYWWHSHLRGDEAEGTVHKEYEVTP